ncbi:BglG family transcription antiterminator [Anaerococcus porci]|uniref:BglG family transcription antiterminator n=1 Tax=Anaerococcus porci TaxID=2652269 RepID=UPI003899208D
MDKSERLLVESLILFLSNDYITKQKLADIMMISRSTITSDLDDLIKFNSKNNLKIVSRSGKGIKLSGNSYNKNIFFIDSLIKSYYLFIILLNGIKKNYNDIALRIEDDKKTIHNIIGEVEYRHNIIFSENSFNILSLYLLYISLNINSEKEKNKYFKGNSVSDLSISLYRHICEYFDIKNKTNEVNYLDILISKLQYKVVNSNANDSISVQFMTRELIDVISNELSIPFYLDYKLFESLSLHVERMTLHGGADIIDYPELRSIIEEKKDLFEKIKKNSYILSKYLERDISDVEISYIVIYIYASFERIIDQVCKKLRVLVVCNSGIGTSQLLNNKLRDLFNFKIIGNTTSHQLNCMDLESIDIIITTVDLSNITDDYLKVSPLINEVDHKKISDYIYEKGRLLISNYNFNSNDSKLINNYEYNNKIFLEDVDIQEGQSLDDLLTEDNIVLDICPKNWKDSIKMASQILLDKKYINEEYINEMIENIEKYGPYIVISENFALPHGNISENVIKTSLSLARLKKPVNFGSPRFDPIKYVCILAVDENKDHLKALFELINLLKVKEFKNSLELARTSKEMKKTIVKYNYLINK